MQQANQVLYLFCCCCLWLVIQSSALSFPVRTSINLTPDGIIPSHDRKFDLKLWRIEYPPYKRPKRFPNNVQDIINGDKLIFQRIPTVSRRDAFQTGWKPVVYNTKSVDNHRSALRDIYGHKQESQQQLETTRQPRLVVNYSGKKANVATIDSQFIKSKFQRYKTKFVPSPKVKIVASDILRLIRNRNKANDVTEIAPVFQEVPYFSRVKPIPLSTVKPNQYSSTIKTSISSTTTQSTTARTTSKPIWTTSKPTTTTTKSSAKTSTAMTASTARTTTTASPNKFHVSWPNQSNHISVDGSKSQGRQPIYFPPIGFILPAPAETSTTTMKTTTLTTPITTPGSTPIPTSEESEIDNFPDYGDEEEDYDEEAYEEDFDDYIDDGLKQTQGLFFSKHRQTLSFEKRM